MDEDTSVGRQQQRAAAADLHNRRVRDAGGDAQNEVVLRATDVCSDKASKRYEIFRCAPGCGCRRCRRRTASLPLPSPGCPVPPRPAALLSGSHLPCAPLAAQGPPGSCLPTRMPPRHRLPSAHPSRAAPQPLSFSACRRHYPAILRLKQFFPFHLIDAMGSLADTQEQIAQVRQQQGLPLPRDLPAACAR